MTMTGGACCGCGGISSLLRKSQRHSGGTARILSCSQLHPQKFNIFFTSQASSILRRSCFLSTTTSPSIPRVHIRLCSSSSSGDPAKTYDDINKNDREAKPYRVADICHRTHNPIRNVVERIKAKPNEKKKLIQLSIGDPTLYGNFSPPSSVLDALANGIPQKGNGIQSTSGVLPHGYLHSSGLPSAREAIARHLSIRAPPQAPLSAPNGAPKLTSEDIFITWGCSQAIIFAFQALARPNTEDTLLIPKPGFALYETVCAQNSIQYRTYDIKACRSPDDGKTRWRIDLQQLRRVLSELPPRSVRGLLFCNPGNPTGGVSPRSEMNEILQMAREFDFPIIADEIYAGMTFSWAGKTKRMAEISVDVPIVEVGGIGKKFMCPGWRVGWIACHDKGGLGGGGRLAEIRDGISRLCTVTLGPTSILQALLPQMLEETPESYHEDVLRRLEKHAEIICEALESLQGVTVVEPEGAMYAMLKLDLDKLGMEDDLEFTNRLLSEESVFVLPGLCFQSPGYVRLCIAPPEEILQQACQRISDFCKRHYIETAKTSSRPSESSSNSTSAQAPSFFHQPEHALS